MAYNNHPLDNCRYNVYSPLMEKPLQKGAKAAKNHEEEAFLHVIRTAEALMWGVAETLKPAGLTPTQYNILRILRGAGEQGLSCKEATERMVTKDSDVTRLLDRLEQQQLIKRERHDKDRRMVLAFITNKGLESLEKLDQPMQQLHKRQLAHLGKDRLNSLANLLELARAKTS
jgi:DNA-binding MarR family transcriptional regulator